MAVNKQGEGLREQLMSVICEHVPGVCEDSGQAEWTVGEMKPLVDAILSLVVGCVPPEREAGVSWGRQDPETHGWNDCRKVLLDNMGVGE